MPIDYGQTPPPPSGGSLQDAIDQLIANAKSGAKGPKPIGVPRDYEAAVQEIYPSRRNVEPLGPGIAGFSTTQIGVAPLYFEGNQYAPANYAPKDITDLQRKMAFVGLFNSSDTMIAGDWGNDTANAFKRLLSYANQHGMDWKSALDYMTSAVSGSQQVGGGYGGTAGGPGGGPPAGAGGRLTVDQFGNLVPIGADTRAPLVTRTTDPKVLETVFREGAMQLMGEGLTPEQVKDMTTSYNQMEIKRQQEAYDKQLTGGSVVDIPSPEAYGQATIPKSQKAKIEEYQALQRMSEAMQALSSPAWGVG